MTENSFGKIRNTTPINDKEKYRYKVIEDDLHSFQITFHRLTNLFAFQGQFIEKNCTIFVRI